MAYLLKTPLLQLRTSSSATSMRVDINVRTIATDDYFDELG